MKKFLPLLAIFLLCLVPASAQKQPVKSGKSDRILTDTQAGKDFYFSFPPNFEEPPKSLERTCRVVVISKIKQTVTVEITGRGYSETKTVEANDVTDFVIPAAVAEPFENAGDTKAPEEKLYLQAGVHVSAQAPISCYGYSMTKTSGEGFAVMPVSALGTEYIVSSYQQCFDNPRNLIATTTITAANDETTVSFTMGGNSSSTTSGGLKPGSTTSFTMNKGDVLCFATNGIGQDISGSRIKSNKPVTVVSGNQSALVPDGIPWGNYICEMEIPTAHWGKEYLVPIFYGRKKNPQIRIYGKEKNTTVFRDGQQWLVIPKNTGKREDGYIERRLDDGNPSAKVVSSNKPIFISVYNTGQSDDNLASSKPFQMSVLPYEQYQKKVAFATPGAKTPTGKTTTNYIALIHETVNGAVPDDLWLGTLTGGQLVWTRIINQFGPGFDQNYSQQINGKSYGLKTLVLPDEGVYALRSSTAFAAYLYGNSATDSYGFPVLGVSNFSWVLSDSMPPTNALAVITFSDLAGNDTTITITYSVQYALSVDPALDFGLVKSGSLVSLSTSIRNTSALTYTVEKLEFSNPTQGFTIDKSILPFTIPAGGTRDITITFTQKNDGFYTDKLSVGSACSMSYLAVTAEVASPDIIVDNHDFGSQVKNTRTSWGNLRVHNVGRVDLTIYSNDQARSLSGKPFELLDQGLKYPFVIKAGEYFDYRVDFIPTVSGDFTATISFASDATRSDIIAQLFGTVTDSSRIKPPGGGSQINKISNVATGFNLAVSPNPMGATGGTAEFMIPTQNATEITLADMNGITVATLAKSSFDTGNYQVRIPVEQLSAGSYILRMVSGSYVEERVIVIVR
ncbi:MAG: choice-of-anchor D domain-containing protein [Ignavibacteria bacterium]|nr:choice-of-anchor D domain-containing protein [Ignavibacteria bacterium]